MVVQLFGEMPRRRSLIVDESICLRRSWLLLLEYLTQIRLVDSLLGLGHNLNVLRVVTVV